jgi:hypothetical protein
MINVSAKYLAHRDHCFEMVERNILPERIHASLLSHARFFELEAQMIPQARALIAESRRLISEAQQLLDRR